ncbi:DUF3159 domain-containing protein [Nonomuraea guangzhouensis]|uniref:DUF3159 domain-containing protein n=1 Tax=Nonomuraea guangzhouensis TaxID=1291555 RepID=A0ABW4GCI2_9ACTN|nr:DUF3159 domain-containing protein [Nonomuraea guangzhouensis]
MQLLRQVGAHVLETALPVLGFTVLFAATGQIAPSLVAALAAAAGVALFRVRQAQKPWAALAGFGVSVGAGALVTVSGNAADFFLPLLVVRGALVVATPILLLLRLPPFGLAYGVLTRQGPAWRRCAVQLRAFTIVNLVWFLIDAALTANQIRLYLDGQAVAMGAVKVLIEAPAYLLSALFLWRLHRRLIARPCRRPNCPYHPAGVAFRRTWASRR